MIGIYGIYNKVEDKFYIGSSLNIGSRVSSHYSELRHNKHSNEKLQQAFNIYGEASFLTIIIEECSESVLREVEQFYIRDWDTYKNGYNKTDSCIPGERMPEISKEKIAGLNHWNSRYSGDALENSFKLLTTTNLSSLTISDITKVDVYTVQHLAQGGHSWLHKKYPELLKGLQNRVVKRSISSLMYSAETILEIMRILLNTPQYTFAEISLQVSVPVETISAISSGRQYQDIINSSNLAEKAKVYFTLGKNEYKNRHIAMSTVDSSNLYNAIFWVVSTNKWHSRDSIKQYTELSENDSRKLTELDEKYLDKYLLSDSDLKLPVLIEYIKLRILKGKNLTHAEYMLNKFNKDDRNVR